jgi:hypothetical protein
MRPSHPTLLGPLEPNQPKAASAIPDTTITAPETRAMALPQA